jgi:hypothetical protein
MEPLAGLIRGKISSDIGDLNVLHEIYPWIPNEAQIRPSPEQLSIKWAKLDAIEREWVSMTDFTLHQIFDKAITILPSGQHAVDDQIVGEDDVRFLPSHFPYDISPGGFHFVLWFGCRTEPAIDINAIISKGIFEMLEHQHFDFAWYENPKMSIPEFYHVHVFWTEF